MNTLHERRVETLERFIEANDEAGRLHDWTGLEPFYAPDAHYHYDTGAVRTEARGPQEITRLVLVRDQLGWMNWTYPFESWAVNGEHAFTRWWNRGPGRRPDGSFYQVIGMSYIRFEPEGVRFIEQIDLFDMGRLVMLCDEIPEELLLPVMREKQLPLMRKLVAQALGV
ncbi:MAG: nuclear transport factor 2 family protein [Myxococcales bacterium]|nr:nuclear transport factor 2 family protein [Myxococcales bacterium]